MKETAYSKVVIVAAVLGLVAVVALGAAAAWTWQATAGAYLVGWFFWISVSAGGVAVLFLSRLTGGRWEAAARPVLTPLALAMPLLALAALPILVSLPALYAWAGESVAVKHAAVEIAYLNGTGYVLRAVVILAVWSALAWFAALMRPPSACRCVRIDRLCRHALFRLGRLGHVARREMGVNRLSRAASRSRRSLVRSRW